MKINLRALILSLVLVALTSKSLAALSCNQDIIRISAVGDVLIHKAPYLSVINSKDGFYKLWSKIAPAFLAADLSYANLEGPAALGVAPGGRQSRDIGFVYDGHIYSGTNFVFNYHPRIIDDLARAGMHVLSIANNHTMDRQGLGLDRTIEALRAKNMGYTGVMHSQDNARYFHTLTSIKGSTIAWISCAEHLNGMRDPKNQVLMCTGKEILNYIRGLKNQTDIHAIVVNPHWGAEYQHKASQSQRSLAQQYVNAGATAVIGNHPHVLQNFEYLTNPRGQKIPVAYSLGNFVSGQGGIAKNTSAVLYMDFKKSKAGSDLEVVRVSALPTFRTPSPHYQVVPLVKMGQATEAWRIVHTTLKGVQILDLDQVPNCR